MLILNVTHSPNVIINNKIMRGGYVGASQQESFPEKYLKDNIGDNISHKNKNYNELTALYWLWKNKSNEDIVGLNHYRRYLDVYEPKKKLFSRLKRDVFLEQNSNRINKINNSEKYQLQVKKILKKKDVILPIKMDYSHNGKYTSLANDYCTHHIKEDWDVLIEVILEKYPVYEESIKMYLYNNTLIYGMNMFIASYSWTNKYCNWLFDILFEVEKRIEISKDLYQKRVFGFMSERLMTLYVMHRQFNVYETQVLNIKKLFKK